MAQPLETMALEEIEAELKEQEKSRYNPSRYMLLCDYLGMEPDLPDLYWEGAFSEYFYWKRLAEEYVSEIEEKEEGKVCLKFLREAEKRHISDRSFEADIIEKIELLSKYFPEKYGDNSTYPVRFLTHRSDVGRIFRFIKDKAKKIREETRNISEVPEVIKRLFVDMKDAVQQ